MGRGLSWFRQAGVHVVRGLLVQVRGRLGQVEATTGGRRVKEKPRGGTPNQKFPVERDCPLGAFLYRLAVARAGVVCRAGLLNLAPSGPVARGPVPGLDPQIGRRSREEYTRGDSRYARFYFRYIFEGLPGQRLSRLDSTLSRVREGTRSWSSRGPVPRMGHEGDVKR